MKKKKYLKVNWNKQFPTMKNSIALITIPNITDKKWEISTLFIRYSKNMRKRSQ